MLNTSDLLTNSVEDAISKMYFYFFLVVDIAKEAVTESKAEEIEGIVFKFKRVAEKIHKESNSILHNQSLTHISSQYVTHRNSPITQTNSLVSSANQPSSYMKERKLKTQNANDSTTQIVRTENSNISEYSKFLINRSPSENFLVTTSTTVKNIGSFNYKSKPLCITCVENLIVIGHESGELTTILKDLHEEVSTTKINNFPIYALASLNSSKGSYFISGEWSTEGMCIAWKKTTEAIEICSKTKFQQQISCLKFNEKPIEESMVYVGLYSGKIIVWDFLKNKTITSIEFHKKEIRSMIIVNSHLLSGGRDKQLLIWDLKIKKKSTFQFKQEHSGWINAICELTNDADGLGLVATGSGDTNEPIIKIWRYGVENSLKTLALHTDFIVHLSYDKQTDCLTSLSYDGSIKFTTFNPIEKSSKSIEIKQITTGQFEPMIDKLETHENTNLSERTVKGKNYSFESSESMLNFMALHWSTNQLKIYTL